MLFGIAISTLLTHISAALGGGTIGAWLHAKWLQVKTAAENEEATIEARLAAVEAALQATKTTPQQ